MTAQRLSRDRLLGMVQSILFEAISCLRALIEAAGAFQLEHSFS